jgi:hypothetical protein
MNHMLASSCASQFVNMPNADQQLPLCIVAERLGRWRKLVAGHADDHRVRAANIYKNLAISLLGEGADENACGVEAKATINDLKKEIKAATDQATWVIFGQKEDGPALVICQYMIGQTEAEIRADKADEEKRAAVKEAQGRAKFPVKPTATS